MIRATFVAVNPSGLLDNLRAMVHNSGRWEMAYRHTGAGLMTTATMSKSEIRERHAMCLQSLRKAIREGDGDTAKQAVERMAELNSMLEKKLQVSGLGYVERPIDTRQYGPNGEDVYLDMGNA